MRPSPPDWDQLHAELDRLATDAMPGMDAALAEMDRQRVVGQRRREEAERLAAKRQRMLERRETIAVWTGVGGNVFPWLMLIATGIIGAIGWLS